MNALLERLRRWSRDLDLNQLLRVDIQQAADELERLHRELTRSQRLLGKADRMFDAIDSLRNYVEEESRLASILACKTAAHEYDTAMSDPAAEATDVAVCRRCERELDSGHDRG